MTQSAKADMGNLQGGMKTGTGLNSSEFATRSYLAVDSGSQGKGGQNWTIPRPPCLPLPLIINELLLSRWYWSRTVSGGSPDALENWNKHGFLRCFQGSWQTWLLDTSQWLRTCARAGGGPATAGCWSESAGSRSGFLLTAAQAALPGVMTGLEVTAMYQHTSCHNFYHRICLL